MKVLHVVPGLGRGGGAERSLIAMAPGLIERDIDLRVCVFTKRMELAGTLGEVGIDVISVDPRSRVGLVKDLAAVVRRTTPDLVHTTLFEADITGRLAAAISRVPVVTSLVNVEYGPEHRADPAVRTLRLAGAWGLDALTARLARRFHALTDEVRREMSRRLAVSDRRIDVVPRGRDAGGLGRRTDARRRETRRQLGISEHIPIVLAVARQDHQKGLDALVRAFAIARRLEPSLRLVHAGRPGGATATIQAESSRADLDGSIHFLGPRDDVPDLLAAADVLVIPSRREGFCGVLVEAMALEIPTVASNIPVLREVAGSSGWAQFVELDDDETLASAILSVIRNPEAARRRGVMGRQRFLDHYTIDRVCDQMAGFYHRSIGRVP